MHNEKLRFGVASITQESNTFAPALSTISDFSIEEGNGVVTSSKETNSEMGGFLQELGALGIETIPLISAWAVSSGPVDDSGFEYLATLLIKRLACVQLDGLLLALHGAWLSTSYSSADAELLRRIRIVLGPTIPIVITLDSHANVTPPLLKEIDGLIGFRTYPHVDMAETGKKAARLLLDIVTQGLHPRLYWLSIPLIAPPQCATSDCPPIRDIFERLDRELPDRVVLSSSLFCVQPWLDMKGVASSLVVVARAESPDISSTLCHIADELWKRRNEFRVDWVAPEMLIQKVLMEKSRPVIVSEAFDGISGGAPGDNPGLISVLLAQHQLSACLFLVDPDVAGRAFQTGLGGRLHGPLGAYFDSRFGPPAKIDARVGHLSDGTFTFKGPVFTGRRLSMGPTAVLEVGKITIVVGSRPVSGIDPELYRSQGIAPEEHDIVGVKSPSLFRPGYASILGRVLHLDMPGVTRGNLAKMPFVGIGRPIWPLDEFHWSASDHPVLQSGYRAGRQL